MPLQLSASINWPGFPDINDTGIDPAKENI